MTKPPEPLPSIDPAALVAPHELIHRNQFLKDGHPHAPIGGHDGHVHFSMFPMPK
ncbi:MAG TPA: hypothetical protein VMJ10_23775 [Kofleriaceae bacterium]|nr:hypothetical protein [Kofleriaceae bacterium]